MGSADEEMAAADGRVDDLQVEKRLLGLRATFASEAFGEERLEGGVETNLDERVGGVVRAGGLPLVPLRDLQLKTLVGAGGGGVDLGVELEELLVDAAELLAAEVFVVDGTAALLVDDVREGPDGGEEGVVGEGRLAQQADRLGRPEIAAEGGDCELRQAGRAAEAPHDHFERLEKIGVAVATEPAGKLLETGCGVVLAVGVAVGFRGRWVEEEIAAFGDKQKNEPIDEAEELPVVLLLVEGTGGQGRLQGLVLGAGEEAAAEGFDGPADAVAQLAEDTRADGGAFDVPLLDEALVRLAVGGDVEAGGVEDEPEEAEVGKTLSLEDALEVELGKRLPRHAHVVAEESQLAAVGDDGPQGLIAAIQKLLGERVGGRLARAGDATGAAVERNIRSHQVHWQMLPLMGDRVGGIVDHPGGGRGSQRAVAELLEEIAKPRFERRGGGRVSRVSSGKLLRKRPMNVEETRPTAGDRLAEPFARGEAVIGACEAREL